ncbi:hypothetical protein EPUS_06392 [Endocarpon pusillum Z07020]|uniref:MARVEL domain-containing protein n=1 Tax=Endocarpon pusillum (strain Z07020 / HMAS-L-300199) TaxID=1263415 RepID=U1GPB8_ENDPU|nr:uncharacterized protein EPUS_06392 [Endocarpon pusillum Z07020]ERF74123.1 hypothetical protein EPUS_06392 [Endocarpon pusillum Z07020]
MQNLFITAPGIGFLTALQFLWTLLVMALVGNIIADATSGNPSIINYDMFVAVFAMLSIIFLLASAFTGVMSGTPIPLALDILNTLFFFCGAVAMSAQLGVHSCSNEGYVNSNGITNGSDNRPKRCRESQATTAFMWFAFITFAASCFFSAMNARAGGVNLRGHGIRKGGPSMSQV